MSKLADVCDRDCLLSFSPIKFGKGSGLVRGAPAILRRILYLWCSRLGSLRHAPTLGMTIPLLDADGVTLGPQDLAGLRAQLRKQAKLVKFVKDATVTVRLDDAGGLHVAALIALTDGKTYPLEVGPAEAFGALGGLGRTVSLTPAAIQSLITNGLGGILL